MVAVSNSSKRPHFVYIPDLPTQLLLHASTTVWSMRFFCPSSATLGARLTSQL